MAWKWQTDDYNGAPSIRIDIPEKFLKQKSRRTKKAEKDMDLRSAKEFLDFVEGIKQAAKPKEEKKKEDPNSLSPLDYFLLLSTVGLITIMVGAYMLMGRFIELITVLHK